jgi:hypothetical protein
MKYICDLAQQESPARHMLLALMERISELRQLVYEDNTHGKTLRNVMFRRVVVPTNVRLRRSGRGHITILDVLISDRLHHQIVVIWHHPSMGSQTEKLTTSLYEDTRRIKAILRGDASEDELSAPRRGQTRPYRRKKATVAALASNSIPA